MAKNGLKFITEASFSAVASMSIDNCFSATYTHYVIKRNLLGSSALVQVNTRLRVGGVDASGANYRYQYVDVSSTTISPSRGTGGTSWPLGLGSTETTSMGFAETWVSNPFDAACTTAWIDNSYAATTGPNLETLLFAHDLTTSYDGMTFLAASGTITGTISVFGLVES